MNPTKNWHDLFDENERKYEYDIEDDGAIKWKSNGHYVPSDVYEKLEKQGAIFNREATDKKREEQTRKFIEDYRKRMAGHKPTFEEQAEMNAAFGPGKKIINVITGEEYITK